MSAHPRLTAACKLLFKLALTALALFIVFLKIDLDKTLLIIQKATPLFLLISLFLYVSSKIISALRLNLFFKNEGIDIDFITNLKLYAVGMFYSLFLPAGIGGDGYKAMFIKKNYMAPLKKIIWAILLDRVSGMIVLSFFCMFFFMFTTIEINMAVAIFIGTSVVIILPAFYLIISIFFKNHLSNFMQTTGYSLVVQGMQVVCAYLVLLSLNLQDSFFIYLALFLISSVFAMFPLTIGGVGARELAFILASDFLNFNLDLAIAFSLLIFLINVVSSLPGIFIRVQVEKEPDNLQLT